jgi:hypothetical protein
VAEGFPVVQWGGIFCDCAANLYRSTMNLEQQIEQLCQAIVDCESDEEAFSLGRKLQPLLQRRLEELRGSLDGGPVS